MRDIVGAVKFQSGMMISFLKKLAQSKPFGLRRRCEECIPAGCRTVLLRNRMDNSNDQSERMRTSADRERQLAAPTGCRTVLLRNRMDNSNDQSERMRTSANRGAAACRKLGVVEGGVETVF